MRSFVLHHTIIFSIAGIMILGAAGMAWKVATTDPLAGLVTTTVTRGTVEQIVSVSGLTKAANAADLAFPTPGIVSKVYVYEGDKVETGDVLATLGAEALVAQRASAVADLRVAQANLQELLAGDTPDIRAVRSTTVTNASAQVARTKTAQALLVENAKRTLMSSGLAARALNPSEQAIPPTVSGTYHCSTEGSYQVTIYYSNTQSGYSMRYTGLESGSSAISPDQPLPLGTCGLSLKITAGESYSNSVWNIAIPNLDAPSYTANKNALDSAQTAAAAANEAAAQALTLAEQEATAAGAAPRSEAVDRAQAQVAKSTAQIAQIDAALGDRVVKAPFAGTVTLVDILPGETASTKPVFTVLATDNLELTARVPEIDITSVALGQPTRVLFDADRSQVYTGKVSYIAPLPIQIDGVAYFEVKVALDTIPAWLRGGLNADIDIITANKENVLRAPKRYVTTTANVSAVRTIAGNTISTTTVTAVFEGNDGFVALDGIAEGTTIVTP
jgi:HlyD family secretion protein